MEATRETHEGKACIFVDPMGHAHAALITRVWGPQCANVVIVASPKAGEDSYGIKLERHTSLMHKSVQQAHGNYWYIPGEE